MVSACESLDEMDAAASPFSNKTHPKKRYVACEGSDNLASYLVPATMYPIVPKMVPARVKVFRQGMLLAPSTFGAKTGPPRKSSSFYNTPAIWRSGTRFVGALRGPGG